jgi:nitronate monooxygenase
MLRTRFTELFDLTHPVLSAPMALHTNGHLAGAVSAAGGLGSLGGTHPTAGPDWLAGEVDAARAITDRPIAVGFITALCSFFEPLFDAALAARPAAIVLSFGDPRPWADRVLAAQLPLICQVQDLATADAAVAAGAAVLIAQGTEAGGHTGTMGLLPLLTTLAARHPDLPLLAAGGISDGRSLAAALTAGADGACIGTPFLATPEAVEVPEVHKKLIVDSPGDDTVLDRAYDIVSGLPWPEGIGARMRRNAFTEQWSGREAELIARREEFAPPPGSNPFPADPDPERDMILYGQGAGAVTAVRPAAEVLHTICAEAEAVLRSRPAALLG